MNSRTINFFIIYLLCANLFAQSTATQNIRGRVTDAQSEFQLIGATVLLWDSENNSPLKLNDQVKGTVTDANGNYRLEGIPTGRYAIKFSYVGFKDRFTDNVLLLVGKETVVNVALEESIIEGEVVVITADKTEPLNEMTMISSRQFTVEETGRYAGSRNDPARMAANFAGVSGNNDSRNDIVIRGNSPTGVLWKMDGLPIGNPNHFGSLGTTGGPVSMLNNNVLANSDFITSAFPAEYGNANAGVFDLQMRKGNSDQHEFLGQIGFNGFEIGAEGPFSKKSDASYLVNYRYSTLGVFQELGMDFGTGVAVPDYQDLSYKINIPTKNAGTFSAFGILGKSDIAFLDSETDTTNQDNTDFYGADGFDSYSDFEGYNVGFNHHYFLNSKSYFKTGVAFLINKNNFALDSLGYVINGNDTTDTIDPGNLNTIFKGKNQENRTVISLQYNSKRDAKNTFLAGSYIHMIGFDYNEKGWEEGRGWVDYRQYDDVSVLGELYTQWLHKFSDRFSINSGLHYQYFALNGSQNIEPRLGAKYSLQNGQSFNFGYGLHGQVLPLAVYTVQTEINPGKFVRTNKDLKMTKSHHLVLGYERGFAKDWRIKVETYYQYLYDVPVEQKSSSFSMLNYGADFGYPETDSLVNEGTGRNYGVELTLEKFLSKGYYGLLTTSIFNSQYKGSDGVMRSTAFNNNYIVNLLAGKEFKFNSRLSLAVDFKMTWSGGLPYSPIDLQQSRLEGITRRDDLNAYSQHYKDYFRADVRAFLRLQGKRATQEWGLDIQNITNRSNIYSENYSRTKDGIETINQIGFFPVPQYRILF